jgi:DNA-3-methyladenine glycosylase I
MTKKIRCDWVTNDPLYATYHDTEWGVPVYDDTKQFEFLVLESAQAGLSWLTVLKRREGYRQAFADFDPAKVALFTDDDIARLMQDAGIIRNKLKIKAAVKNAQVFLAIQREFGSFSSYIWGFVGGTPQQNHWESVRSMPATSAISDALSADLKRRGMSFVGSTIMYAHLQATGLLNDHIVGCFRYAELLNSMTKQHNIEVQ